MESGPSNYARREWVSGMALRDSIQGRGRVAEEVVKCEYGGNTAKGRREGSRSRSQVHAGQSGNTGVERRLVPMGLSAECAVTMSSALHPRKRTRSTRPDIPLVSLLPAFLLPFLPVTSAAPPLARRTASSSSPPPSPRTTSPPTVTQPPARREVQYVTSAAPPSSLPAEVRAVDERLLPFILSEGPDGYWTRVNEGWRLYGRQSGVSQVVRFRFPRERRGSYNRNRRYLCRMRQLRRKQLLGP